VILGIGCWGLGGRKGWLKGAEDMLTIFQLSTSISLIKSLEIPPLIASLSVFNSHPPPPPTPLTPPPLRGRPLTGSWQVMGTPPVISSYSNNQITRYIYMFLTFILYTFYFFYVINSMGCKMHLHTIFYKYLSISSLSPLFLLCQPLC
jgi:hypothetical protein